MILDTFKILFFGSSNYCMPVLHALDKHCNLTAVITQPDKPVGRKQILTPSIPKQFALSHNVESHRDEHPVPSRCNIGIGTGIEVFTPRDKAELLALKSPLKNLKPDIGIVADYGLIIPKEIYQIPRLKTLNIHFSRLPELRGPSPVQYTILMGGKNAWISILFVAEELDTGDILWQKEVIPSRVPPSRWPDTTRPPRRWDEAKHTYNTTQTLYKKLFNITATELPNVLSLYAKTKLVPTKQNHSKATYTKILTREDGYIPLEFLDKAINGENITLEPFLTKLPEKSILRNPQFANFPIAQLLDSALRAFTPWPGIWTVVKIPHPKRLKILKIRIENEKLVLDQVQLEGKKPVSFKQFIKGYPNFSF